jgi:ParB-like chromosome segregation protein Spo0J
MTEPERHPVSSLFPPLTDGEYQALVESVREQGVLVPVTLDAEGRIVDGWHRARAAAEAGQPHSTVRLAAGVNPWARAWALNGDRRQMSAAQRTAVLRSAEKAGLAPEVTAIREAAAAREQSGEGDPTVTRPEGPQRGEAADEIGALIGVSGSTVRRVEKAEKVGGDEALDAIESGTKSPGQIIREATPPTKMQASAYDLLGRAASLVEEAATVTAGLEGKEAGRVAKRAHGLADLLLRIERELAPPAADFRDVATGLARKKPSSGGCGMYAPPGTRCKGCGTVHPAAK